jgi:hypothetical protein
MVIGTPISVLVLSAHGWLPETSHRWGFSCTSIIKAVHSAVSLIAVP